MDEDQDNELNKRALNKKGKKMDEDQDNEISKRATQARVLESLNKIIKKNTKFHSKTHFSSLCTFHLRS
jgi:hypothetical protein